MHTGGRGFLILLGALVGLGPASVDLYLPSLPMIARDLAAGTSATQWTLSAFFIGFGSGMLVFGSLSDHYGRRVLLLTAGAVAVASSIACALATQIEYLIAFRFLQAVGTGALGVLTRAVVRDIYDTSGAARALSLMAMVTAIVPLVAPTLGGQLLLMTSWRGLFGLIGGIGAVGLLLAWLRIPETLPAHRRLAIDPVAMVSVYARILKSRLAWGYILCAAGMFAAMFAYITEIPFVYITYFGVSPTWFGVLFGLNIVSQMTFTWANSRFVDRAGIPRMMAIGATVGLTGGAGVLGAAMSGTLGLAGIALPLLLVIGPTILLTANTNARLMQLYPDNAGAATALLYFLLFLISGVASFAVSILHNGTPMALGLVIFASGALSLGARAFLARE